LFNFSIRTFTTMSLSSSNPLCCQRPIPSPPFPWPSRWTPSPSFDSIDVISLRCLLASMNELAVYACFGSNFLPLHLVAVENHLHQSIHILCTSEIKYSTKSVYIILLWNSLYMLLAYFCIFHIDFLLPVNQYFLVPSGDLLYYLWE
jgi:hypothetical protein